MALRRDGKAGAEGDLGDPHVWSGVAPSRNATLIPLWARRIFPHHCGKGPREWLCFLVRRNLGREYFLGHVLGILAQHFALGSLMGCASRREIRDSWAGAGVDLAGLDVLGGVASWRNAARVLF